MENRESFVKGRSRPARHGWMTCPLEEPALPIDRDALILCQSIYLKNKGNYGPGAAAGNRGSPHRTASCLGQGRTAGRVNGAGLEERKRCT